MLDPVQESVIKASAEMTILQTVSQKASQGKHEFSYEELFEAFDGSECGEVQSFYKKCLDTKLRYLVAEGFVRLNSCNNVYEEVTIEDLDEQVNLL